MTLTKVRHNFSGKELMPKRREGMHMHTNSYTRERRREGRTGITLTSISECGGEREREKKGLPAWKNNLNQNQLWGGVGGHKGQACPHYRSKKEE